MYVNVVVFSALDDVGFLPPIVVWTVLASGAFQRGWRSSSALVGSTWASERSSSTKVMLHSARSEAVTENVQND